MEVENAHKRQKLAENKTFISSNDEIFEIVEQDLPLLANINEVIARHYLMKLHFDFNSQKVFGVVIIFLHSAKESKPWEKIILDCCCIKVKCVHLLKTFKQFNSLENPFCTKNFYKFDATDWFSLDGSEAKCNATKWSLEISGWPLEKIEECPTVIRIHYEVSSASPSLNWRPIIGMNYHYNGHKCVFTPASSVNNRGLFPCQEPPTAMATWECFIKVDKTYLPLLSSNEDGEIIKEDEKNRLWYFYSSMILPMSTFALVIAQFPLQLKTLVQAKPISESYQLLVEEIKCNHSQYPCRIQNKSYNSSETVPVRLFSVVENLNVDLTFFANFLETCLKALFKILGPHPFDRIDLIILPNCFPVMGLCSPHLIFLPPSLFCGNEPLYYFRIPHEISHLWFGLLIGNLNLEEEFLTEGFATFLEDILYKEIFSQLKPDIEIQTVSDTKACLHLLTLQNELKNTDSNLHVLSPESVNNSNELSSKSIKFGLEPMKEFMQVHYLKGYFLLKYLSSLVGEKHFFLFLKKYVLKYHGQLVSSQMFFELYQNNFSTILNFHPDLETIKNIESIWLRTTDLPEILKSCDVLNGNFNKTFLVMFPSCHDCLSKIIKVFEMISTHPIPTDALETCLKNLSTLQIVLFLEKVIAFCSENEEPFFDPKTTRTYEFIITSDAFKIENQNPDIIHRLCELIILNCDVSRKHIIENFLEYNQSMGVYLYGELMISENRSFQNLARRLYEKQAQVLDNTQIRVLRDMIF